MKRLLFLIPLLALRSSLRADPLGSAVKSAGGAADSTVLAGQALTRDVSDVLLKYKLTNVGKCALLVVGTSATGTVPIYFVPGPQPIAALQADLTISTPTVSITSMAQGPDLSTYGKQLSSNKVGSSWRFLVFGLNLTPIGPGTMGMASIDTSKMAKSFASASLSNFIASDPSGVSVPLCVTTGVITK